MTESEAIEILKGKFPQYAYEGIYLDEDKYEYEMAQLAIHALEKQIPKKVQLRHIRKFDGFDDGECPTCGGSVSRDCDGIDIFCLDCGQKLDWGDEK